MLANTLVPVETSSKVAASPLASGDPQVTLSHVECSPQDLALDPARPLVGVECDQLVNICSFAVRCDRTLMRTSPR